MKTAILKLHLAVFLWGFTAILGKLISLNEVILVWYRLIIVFIAILGTLIYKKELQKISTNQIKQLLFYGAIITIHWIFFYGSIKYSNISIALVCLSSTGVMAAILEPILLRHRIKPIEVLLGSLAVIGIGLIFHFETKFRTGIVLGLLAAFFTVLFSILNKKVVTIIHASTIMLYEYLGGIIIITALLPLYHYFFPKATLVPTTADAMWLIILSICLTILPMNLTLQALQKISAFTLNLVLNLEPVYGIALAFIFFKENKELSSNFYWGLLLICLAVVFQMIRILRKKA